jgi:response regulator RpfG family c-di-GMP phosphodiesterase
MESNQSGSHVMQRRETEMAETILAGAKILLIDDSRTTRKYISAMLTEQHAEITEAENGMAGYNHALSGVFDLIISDIMMPGLSGLDLCSKLKVNPGTQNTPIILISSKTNDEWIEQGFKAGASAFINKSEIMSQLTVAINQVLMKRNFNQRHYILVVEDSPTIRDITVKVLSNAGYRVSSAIHGQDALEKIRVRKPDLIITDLEMPVMDGIVLTTILHLDPVLSDIPVIIASSLGGHSIMHRMLERGVAAYLTKPFNAEQLIISVDRLLSEQYKLLLKERQRLEQETKFMLFSIESLSQALEARDPYTRGHSEDVVAIALEIGNVMNLSAHHMERLQIGAKLHDIGKIGIPDRILCKPGPLTEEEWALMKRHPVIGAEILRPIPSLTDVIPVMLYHHESYDGTGYPEHLRGEHIPLWARITMVADVFHALVSNRPYRPALPVGKALQMVSDLKLKKLCPECVDAFLQTPLASS